jgi:hypothetical protein
MYSCSNCVYTGKDPCIHNKIRSLKYLSPDKPNTKDEIITFYTEHLLNLIDNDLSYIEHGYRQEVINNIVKNFLWKTYN